jgi:hypothetical protein
MSGLRPKTQAAFPTKALPWLLPANTRIHEGRYRPLSLLTKTKEPVEAYPTLLIRTLQQPYSRVKSAELRVLSKQRSTESLVERARYVMSPEDMKPFNLRLSGSQINLSDFIEDKQQNAGTNQYSEYLKLMKNRHQTFIKRQLKRGPSLIKQKSKDYEENKQKQVAVMAVSLGDQKTRKNALSLSTTLTEIRKKLILGFTRFNETMKIDLRSRSYSPQCMRLKNSLMQAQGTKLKLRPKRGLQHKHLF